MDKDASDDNQQLHCSQWHICFEVGTPLPAQEHNNINKVHNIQCHLAMNMYVTSHLYTIEGMILGNHLNLNIFHAKLTVQLEVI